jgi:hypothetical protein
MQEIPLLAVLRNADAQALPKVLPFYTFSTFIAQVKLN